MLLSRFMADLSDGSRLTITVDGELGENDQQHLDHLIEIRRLVEIMIDQHGSGPSPAPRSNVEPRSVEQWLAER